MPHFRSMIQSIAVLFALLLATTGGQAQSVFVAPSTVDFGSQTVGTSGGAWTLTVNNIGATQVALGTISLSDSADFVESTTCGAALGAYSNCNVTVSFSPSTAGQINGQLLVPVVGNSTPLSVPLTGNATSVSPSFPSPNFAPNSINFGPQALSTSSNAFSASLNNSGPGELDITSLTVSDPTDFSVTSTCAAKMAGYSNCQVLVVFTPSTVGPITGSVTLISNGSPQTMSLSGSGTGVTTSVVVSPASLSFGSQAVGVAGTSQIVTISNTGSNSIALANFQLAGSGAFSVVNSTCGPTLAGNSTCNVPIAFTAAAAGLATGQLTFTANGAAESVPLQGTGTTSVATVLISPDTVDFGTVVAGTSAGPWTISVNNISASTATFAAAPTLSGSSAFTFTSTCSTTLPAHANCNIAVTFAPAAAGPYAAQISLQTTASSTPQTVTLSGNATSTTPALLIAPSEVDFGSVQTGTTASAWTLSVSNPTGGVVSFGSPISVSGSHEFAISTTCGLSLAAYSSCQVLVSFAPAVAGQVHGQLVVNVAGGATQTASLTGTGVGAPLTPTVSVSPLVHDFGSEPLGSGTQDVLFTVTNSGSTDAYFASSASITGSTSFVLDQNSCPNPITAGTSCIIAISFRPKASGTQTGELLLPFFGMTNPLIAGLNGTGGVPAKLAITPATSDFGGQAIGAASAAQSVTLANNSGAAIPFTLGVVPAGYSVTSNCASSVPANSSCVLNVVFTPTQLGAEPGTLSIGENGQLNVDQILFTGSGTGVSFPFATYDFGLVPSLSPNGATASLQISDVGAGHPHITSITATGPFQANATCALQLMSSSPCAEQVFFLPTAVGPATGTLVVTFVGGTSQSMNLTGTGTTPVNLTLSPASGGTTPNTTVGQTFSQTLTVTNSGAKVNLSLGAVTSTLGGWKQVSTTCGSSIASGASCLVNLAFTPTAAGQDTVTLVFTDATDNWPYTWTMTGQGIAAPALGLVASPTSIHFPDFSWNAPDNSIYLAPITLTNPTNATIAFAVNSGDPDYVVFDGASWCQMDSTGYYHIAPGQTCVFNVVYYLGTLFARDGQVNSTISFTTSAGATTSVAVSGYSPYGNTANASGISLSTNSLVFPATAVGSASTAQSVTVTNTTNSAEWIWFGPTWNGAPTPYDFQEPQSTCNAYVAAHTSCTVQVVFTPEQSGSITNYLQFQDSNTGATVTLPLLGSGYLNGASAPNPIGSYSLQAYPSELTLSGGQSGTAKFTLTPVGGFKGTVALSCGPLPTGVSCSFSPTTLTADGSNTVLTSTLTVSTVGIHGGAQGSQGASFGLLAAVSLLGMWFGRRKLRIGILPLAMSLLLVATAASSMGCGSGLSSLTTPGGASTVLVKAASVVNGSTTIEEYASFKLTINQ